MEIFLNHYYCQFLKKFNLFSLSLALSQKKRKKKKKKEKKMKKKKEKKKKKSFLTLNYLKFFELHFFLFPKKKC